MIADEKESFQLKRREIYNRIIYILDRYLPHKYKRAVLGCFYNTHLLVPTVKIFYYTDGSNEYAEFIARTENSDIAASELSDLCEELHSLMCREGSKWTSFTFTRERIGRFKAKFGYEKINSVNHIFLLNWRSKYF